MEALRTVFDLPEEEARTPLPEEQALLIKLKLMTMVTETADVPIPLTPESGMPAPWNEKMPFHLKVLVKRLQWAGGSYSPVAMIFCAMLSRSPGHAVTFAYALWRRWKTTGQGVSLDDLMDNTSLGAGPPTEENLLALWDEQKDHTCPLGNKLDSPATWGKESGDVMREASVEPA